MSHLPEPTTWVPEPRPPDPPPALQPPVFRPPGGAPTPAPDTRIRGRHRRPWSTGRAVVIGLLVAAGLLVGSAGARLLVHASSPARQPVAPTTFAPTTFAPAPPEAVAIWSGWAAQRAAAYAAGSPEALARLYADGAGAGDVAVLRRYADRGLRVVGLTEQVLSVRVRQRSDDGVTLVLVSRLAAAVARGEHGEVALPTGRTRRRVVALRRDDGQWRVISISGSRPR